MTCKCECCERGRSRLRAVLEPVYRSFLNAGKPCVPDANVRAILGGVDMACRCDCCKRYRDNLRVMAAVAYRVFLMQRSGVEIMPADAERSIRETWDALDPDVREIFDSVMAQPADLPDGGVH